MILILGLQFLGGDLGVRALSDVFARYSSWFLQYLGYTGSLQEGILLPASAVFSTCELSVGSIMPLAIASPHTHSSQTFDSIGADYTPPFPTSLVHNISSR